LDRYGWGFSGIILPALEKDGGSVFWSYANGLTIALWLGGSPRCRSS
jgi:hypothetical protein